MHPGVTPASASCHLAGSWVGDFGHFRDLTWRSSVGLPTPGRALLFSWKKKQKLGLVHDSGVGKARGRQRAPFRCDAEDPRAPSTWGWLLGFVSWLWDLEVEPLPCSPEDLTRATETKESLRDRAEFSSEKACSITSLCYLGFKNYLLWILGQDREEQGHIKIIFASTLCSTWCARLATLPLISVWQGKMFTWKCKAQKPPGRKLRGCKISSHFLVPPSLYPALS